MLGMVYPTPKSVPSSAVCVHVCTELKSDRMNRSKQNEIIRNMYKATSAKLPVACLCVCVCTVPSEFFVLHSCLLSQFRPMHDRTHLLLLLRYIFVSLLLRRTHGPSISTHIHIHIPLCSCWVRTLCVVLTQVVYYIIVRVFKLKIVKRTPSPNQSFVLWMSVPVHSIVCWRRLSKRMCAFTHANVHNNQWKV